MSTLFAYNMHDSVDAENLFAIQNKDDVFSDVYACTSSVHVESAYLDDVYRGYGKLHQREITIHGTVNKVFIEDYDDRVFPCGAKTLEMKPSQDVTIRWVLSIDEAAKLESMGCTYDDFQLPANLVGNDIEIPLTIKYSGIYESPVAGVEILDAYNLMTSTKDNQYYGIWDTCTPSAEVENQKADTYEFCPAIDHSNEVSIPVYEDQAEAQEQTEQSLPEKDDDAKIDENNINAVRDMLADQEAKRAEKAVATKADTNKAAKNIVDIVNATLKKAEQDKFDANATNPYEIADENKAVFKPEKASYADFKAAVADFDKEKAKLDAKKSTDAAHTVDTATDNILLNEGYTDIAGMASTTDAQLKDKLDEKSGKKSIDNARINDIAADNKALNEDSNADISGQGVDTNKKAVKHSTIDTSAQELVKNLFASQSDEPKPDDSQGVDSQTGMDYL